MEHRSAMHALGARQKVHGFTLRKPQSDRLLACPSRCAAPARDATRLWRPRYGDRAAERPRVCCPDSCNGWPQSRAVRGAPSAFPISQRTECAKRERASWRHDESGARLEADRAAARSSIPRAHRLRRKHPTHTDRTLFELQPLMRGVADRKSVVWGKNWDLYLAL